MPTHKRSNRHQRPKREASWDRLAIWYDSWMGQRGGNHHRDPAIPVVIELLSPRPGERILDVACGQGVLARHILQTGAVYKGVDASRGLLRLGRKRHPGANFVHGDARRLTETPGLRPAMFHAAVILFSLQDIDPLEDVIRSTAEVLMPGGRLVFLITHPAFRIPRQSGWGWDPERKLRYRRIDSYLTRLAIPLAPSRAPTVMTSYHRPLADYLNAMADAGLRLDALREVTPPKAASESKEIPLYLAVRAVKDERPPRQGPIVPK